MSLNRMVEAVRNLHDARGFRSSGGEDPLWRVALLAEEVGEIAAAITKGEGNVACEHADLLIALLGNCVSFGIDIDRAFWEKMRALEHRPTQLRHGHARLGKVTPEGPP